MTYSPVRRTWFVPMGFSSTVWLLALVSMAPAQETATLSRLTGEQMNVDIQSIADGKLFGRELSDGIDWQELMLIRTGRRIVNQQPNISLFLADGGKLNVSSITYENEKFQIQLPESSFSLAADAVAGVLFDPNADSSNFDRALSNRSAESDRLIAKTDKGQQTVAGLLDSITGDKVKLNYQGKLRSISIGKVVAIVAADLKPAPLQGDISTVTLVDGSTVRGQVEQLREGRLQIRLVGNQSITLPWELVSVISVASDRVAYLSDLTPIEAEQNPLATIGYPWQRDLSVEGRPIRLANSQLGSAETFEKGIGVHSASRLEFENSQDFDRFVAKVGIDVETGGRGHCLASVWADGIKLWSAELIGGNDPKSVNVDISGMRRISLVVQYGQHLDLGDHVDWAAARFIKTQ